MPLYDSLIYDLMAKSNAKYKKQYELLKDMIQNFLSGEYSKDRLNQEYRALIEKDKKEKEV
jgi:hypothetical protein